MINNSKACDYCGRKDNYVYHTKLEEITTLKEITKALGKDSVLCTYCKTSLNNEISKIDKGISKKFGLDYQTLKPKYVLVLNPAPYVYIDAHEQYQQTYADFVQGKNFYGKTLLYFPNIELAQKAIDFHNYQIRHDDPSWMHVPSTRDKEYPSIRGFYIEDMKIPDMLHACKKDQAAYDALRNFEGEEYCRLRDETLEKYAFMFTYAADNFIRLRKDAAKRRIKKEEREAIWEPIAQ